MGRFLAENPSGILVDRFGRKPLIVGGLAILLPSYILCFVAQGVANLYVGVALVGVAFVVSNMGSQVYISDIAPPDKRATYMGIYQSTMMGAGIIGPILGGVIAESFGLRAPFLVSIFLAILSMLLALMKVREPEHVESIAIGKTEGLLQDYATFLKNKYFLALFGIAFLANFGGPSYRSIALPVYAADVLQISVVQITLVDSVTSLGTFLVRFFVVPVLEGRVNRKLVITGGHLLRGLAVYSILLVPNFYGLAALSAISGRGMGIYQPFTNAVWIDSTEVRDRGRVFGLRDSFMDFGMTISPTVVGLLMGIDLRFPFYAVASISMVSALSFFVILSHARKDQR